MKKTSLVIIDIVGLSPALLAYNDRIPNINSIMKKNGFLKLKPPFPALTCTFQASLTTGEPPSSHGVVCNGIYDRQTREVNFWARYNNILTAPRIWNKLNVKTSVLFFQNSVYCGADYVVTPAPIHNHDGGMIQWCYSKPANLYTELTGSLGRPFNLMNFWGPMVSFESSKWIFESAKYIFDKYSPDLSYVYIPHLDYNSQKFGPLAQQSIDDLNKVDSLVGDLLDFAKNKGAGVVILSEYGLVGVKKGIDINRVLRCRNWLKTILIQDKEYIDFENSDAFAMVDHQVAHIYIQNKNIVSDVKAIIQNIEGVEMVLDSETKKEYEIDHLRSGELIAVANKQSWFDYYWWLDDSCAPGFTRTVDIHRKPGYDPLELFFDPSIKGIPYTTDLIKGSHGRPARSDDELAVFIADIPYYDYSRFFGSESDCVCAQDIAKAVQNYFRS